MRRLTPLPRVSRDPAALKAIIARKAANHQNCAREQRELEIAVARQMRRELNEINVDPPAGEQAS